MIDQLLEKWLTGFKKYGHLVDVFENPTKKDLGEHQGKFRFIADVRTKTIWTWQAMGALHADAWQEIKKSTGIATVLYKHPALLPGTVDNGNVDIHAAEYMSQAIRKGIQAADWTFVHKYLTAKEIESFQEKLRQL